MLRTRMKSAGTTATRATAWTTAIKNGSATLNRSSRTLPLGRMRRVRRRRRWGRRRRRLVHRARTGLRHDHTPRSRGRRRRGRRNNRRRSLRRCGRRRRSRGHRSRNFTLSLCSRRTILNWRRRYYYRIGSHRSRGGLGNDRSSGDRRLNFDSSRRRPGHDRAGRRLGGNRRRGRRRGHHDAGLLTRLRNDSAGRRRSRRHKSLTLSAYIGVSEVGPCLSGSAKAHRALAGSGRSTGRRRRRCGCRYRRSRRYSGTGRSNRGGGCSRRILRDGRMCRGDGHRGPLRGALRSGRGFVFALLDRFEHVSRLGDSRPVDFLLRLAAILPGRCGAIPATTLEVPAHTLRFVFFKRAGVGLFLGNPDSCQGIQNLPAFHFQFAC
jgi:hypothetical protein